MLRFYRRGESFHSSLEGLPPWNLQAQFLGSTDPHELVGASPGALPRRSQEKRGSTGPAAASSASLGSPGTELKTCKGSLSGGWHAHPPAFAEATELLPTGCRALITLSRQSLYLYEFVLKKNPQTIQHGDLSYRLSSILFYSLSP